ncbi:uncharacterized protein ASPGLDRAFT_66532 [Aspergillus glaucus CBS 516.65]|uniref:Ras-GEF domain-containing protein n=1 Tax=Aspergillus glaucus CBS 516.65 TaxID=1160497 RepID=A0A1L9VK36_ASPGL|nr:hypothetical protein ASPGLDRAFT_66532 [Aspergillus glaucus CBS 516.65]OJJ84264.1 hypothetical protein ASPGLDRAFT_66532 [Aspergillus glaucus CBS 516.65]
MYGVNPYEKTIFGPIFTTAGDTSPYPAMDNGMDSLISLTPQSPLAGSTFIPVQSTYPSLFRPNAERPRFSVSYKWWEDEATTVLWAFDAGEIQRVIRYGLFPDENLPRTALQSRNESTVDSFLFTLVQPHERPFIANLSHVQKVEEILRRSKGMSPALVPWSWFPSVVSREQDPGAIAKAIDAESRLHFTRIPFEEWVRYSLGYRSILVESFLEEHTKLFHYLLNYFDAFPEELKRYAEVEKHLRRRSPFAHRALVQSLLTVQSGGEHRPPLSPVPGFDFIAGPIQRLFKEHPPSLTAILKVLCVLEVRFERMYLHIPEMDWYERFDTTVTFFEDVLASTSAVDLARTLTTTDEGHFSELDERDLMTEGPVARQIIVEWHTLSMAVWEVCSALPDLIPYIQECVQTLFLIRNYHSLTAMLNGLQKYSILAMTFNNVNSATGTVTLGPVLPADLFYLLNPFHNYLAYRQQFHEAPGIPFLLPHIREFKQHGQGVLRQLFQEIQIPLP